MIARCSLAAWCLLAGLMLASQSTWAQDRPAPDRDQARVQEDMKFKEMQQKMLAKMKAVQEEMKTIQAQAEKRRAAIEKAMQEEMKGLQAEMQKRQAMLEKMTRELHEAARKRAEAMGRDFRTEQPRVQPPVPLQPRRAGSDRPDVERRLGEIEQKLDQLIREFGNLRRELGQPRGGRGGSGGAIAPTPPSTPPGR